MKHLVVIGGGPAGASAAIYGARGGLNVTVFAKGPSALEKADKIENYYGFPTAVSGEELLERGQEQAKNLGAVFMKEEVVGLGFDGKLIVTTEEGSYPADAVVLAMGSPRRAPKIEGLKEFEGKGVSYCAVCDGFFFRGKDVAVLGTGEFAKHEAEALRPLAKSVTQIEGGVTALRGQDGLEELVFEDGHTLPVSGLFIAEGTAGSADLARKLGAYIEGNRIVVDENMATNIPGLFAAGDGTGGLMQVAKAVHDGAVAGLSAVKFLKTT